MRVKSWLVVVLGMVVVLGGLGGAKYLQISSAIAAMSAYPEPQETVEAVMPRAGTWMAKSRAVGTAVSIRQVNLRNELAGSVREMSFTSGDTVEAGQVLLRQDIRREEAELAAAKADAELARLTLERRERLAKTQVISVADLDQARAQLQAARAQVAQIEVAIAKKTLSAPFRARVGLTNLQPGEYLSEGTLVATLQGIDPDAYVDFSFPQDLAAFLRVGSKVDVTGAGLPGRAEAMILASEAAIDNTSRNVRFRAVVKGAGDNLRPGAFVDIEAPVSAPQSALFLPLTAVRRAPYGDHVFVLAESEGKLRAQQRFVRLGAVQGEETVVLSGLQPGERVAGKGSFKLREGLLVNLSQAQAAAPAATAGK